MLGILLVFETASKTECGDSDFTVQWVGHGSFQLSFRSVWAVAHLNAVNIAEVLVCCWWWSSKAKA